MNLHSTAVTLAWEIWLRNRRLIQLAIGLMVFTCLFNALLPDLRESKGDAGLLNFYLAAAAVLLILAISSFTEFNPQRGTNGFPHRLFVMPVSTLQLVGVPMMLGIATVEIASFAWTTFVLPPEQRSMWIAIQFGVFMVLYQTVLWTLPGLKAFRLLVIGVIGFFIITLRMFPFVQGLSDTAAISLLVGIALAAFLLSWVCVARQRSGVSLTSFLTRQSVAHVEVLAPSLPLPQRPFRSAQAAQFWFEWRRSGYVLPLQVGALLVLVIAPLSWLARNDGAGSLRILAAVFATPMILALAVGKAFSKPDFWSKEMALPGFIAVRPLAAADIVAAKIKVAAVSSAISWLIVLAFLALWLPLWANLESFSLVRGILWMIYGHKVYPQYLIAVLAVIASTILTWRFMVGGLWLGLVGDAKVFALSAIPYAIVPLFVLPLALITEESIIDWIQNNTNRWLPPAVWLAAAGVVVRFWLAAYAWRNEPQYLRRYFAVWLAGTSCLIALAFLLGDLFGAVLPADTYRVRNLLILIALHIMPLARLGLAPAFLDKNRHR